MGFEPTTFSLGSYGEVRFFKLFTPKRPHLTSMRFNDLEPLSQLVVAVR